jgi:hypothetical protein
MFGLLTGVVLIAVGWVSLAAHQHNMTPDIRALGLTAIFLGGVLIVAWLGGRIRFLTWWCDRVA